MSHESESADVSVVEQCVTTDDTQIVDTTSKFNDEELLDDVVDHIIQELKDDDRINHKSVAVYMNMTESKKGTVKKFDY